MAAAAMAFEVADGVTDGVVVPVPAAALRLTTLKSARRGRGQLLVDGRQLMMATSTTDARTQI